MSHTLKSEFLFMSLFVITIGMASISGYVFLIEPRMSEEVEPKLHFQEKVLVVRGFFDGHIGTIKEYKIEKGKPIYKVQLESKLMDIELPEHVLEPYIPARARSIEELPAPWPTTDGAEVEKEDVL